MSRASDSRAPQHHADPQRDDTTPNKYIRDYKIGTPLKQRLGIYETEEEAMEASKAFDLEMEKEMKELEDEQNLLEEDANTLKNFEDSGKRIMIELWAKEVVPAPTEVVSATNLYIPPHAREKVVPDPTPPKLYIPPHAREKVVPLKTQPPTSHYNSR